MAVASSFPCSSSTAFFLFCDAGYAIGIYIYIYIYRLLAVLYLLYERLRFCPRAE